MLFQAAFTTSSPFGTREEKIMSVRKPQITSVKPVFSSREWLKVTVNKRTMYILRYIAVLILTM